MLTTIKQQVRVMTSAWKYKSRERTGKSDLVHRSWLFHKRGHIVDDQKTNSRDSLHQKYKISERTGHIERDHRG